MKAFIAWIESVAIALGGPGLFIIAFLDSSFLSLPEINDLLLVLMVTKHPHLMPYYATMVVLGSITGCLVMYFVGYKGGEVLLRKRFKASAVDRTMALMQRYGVLVVLIPSLLPPPAPFKIFVILSGVAKIPLWRFVTAIAIGRGLRYFGEGLLAVWYGEMAMQYIEENGRQVSLVIVGALAGGLLLYLLWRRIRRRAGGQRPDEPTERAGL